MSNSIGLGPWILRVTIFFLIFSSGTCLAHATGVIYGTVTDPSGATVAGAKVQAILTDRGTIRTGATGTSGDYVFSAMSIGSYDIRISAPGFQEFRHRAVTLNANQNVRLDAALTLGSAAESSRLRLKRRSSTA